ncbi:MAG TPA: hypothetical protein VF992_04115 [Thermoplasmata archaeon]
MGFDERHVLPALRLMPYDRLVVVAGRDSFRSAGFRRLKDLEPSLRSVVVRPFDLLDSLGTVRRTILESAREGPVRLSVSGGTKILANAAILAAFLEGIETWYCETTPIRLPVLSGVRLGEPFPASERAIMALVRRAVTVDGLVARAGARGMSRRTAVAAIRSLASKGLLTIEVRAGRSFARPSERSSLFRSHLAAAPGKA